MRLLFNEASNLWHFNSPVDMGCPSVDIGNAQRQPCWLKLEMLRDIWSWKVHIFGNPKIDPIGHKLYITPHSPTNHYQPLAFDYLLGCPIGLPPLSCTLLQPTRHWEPWRIPLGWRPMTTRMRAKLRNLEVSVGVCWSWTIQVLDRVFPFWIFQMFEMVIYGCTKNWRLTKP